VPSRPIEGGAYQLATDSATSVVGIDDHTKRWTMGEVLEDAELANNPFAVDRHKTRLTFTVNSSLPSFTITCFVESRLGRDVHPFGCDRSKEFKKAVEVNGTQAPDPYVHVVRFCAS